RVFPGFTADFTLNSTCILNPYEFKDATFTRYGVIDSWKWNLGEANTTTDEFTIKNPTYLYPTTGIKSISLIVSNSKGCIDTVTRNITVLDKPILNLPFKDTLICSIDTLPLIANGTGVFLWTPNNFISNVNISNPFVYPKDTTTYVVQVSDNGCVATDSIKVNVLDFIAVNAGLDTNVCRTDTVQLSPISDALGYAWSSSTGEVVNNVKFPKVRPLVNTDYFVRANLGKCEDKDTISVKVFPYPQVNVVADTAICFGARTTFRASIVGSSFNWSPSSSLINANTLSPTAGPIRTTTYILSVFDTLGCPKPTRDTVVLKVFPIVTTNAGRDTFVVVNQPLQLNASSTADAPTTLYKWTPTIGLNNNSIFNPIATLNSSVDSVRYIVRATTKEGCFGEDNVLVTVFKSEPDIFVPTGFT
ncbi:MAG: PKD domain-containing protein, partial [Dolichospermum sp.]